MSRPGSTKTAPEGSGAVVVKTCQRYFGGQGKAEWGRADVFG
jgi:hypothetical protein